MTDAKVELLIDRLCDLHRRLVSCWDQGTGKPKLRRPRLFTPQWADKDTVLYAAIALERAKAAVLEHSDAVMGEAVLEAITGSLSRNLCSLAASMELGRGNEAAKVVGERIYSSIQRALRSTPTAPVQDDDAEENTK